VDEPWHPTWNNSRRVASNLVVVDLWDQDGQTWKEWELKLLFDMNGVNAVRNLKETPRQGSEMSNRLIWTATENDRYSVKFGYHMLMEPVYEEAGEVQRLLNKKVGSKPSGVVNFASRFVIITKSMNFKLKIF
jgi:hypothetical protein